MVKPTNSQIKKLTVKLALPIFLSFNIQISAIAADVSSTQICNSEGALGIRFGDKFSGKRIQADNFLFGSDCYLVKPSVTLPYFDTYAACVSAVDGKIFSIQAAKTLDVTPPKGSLELTPAQVSSNRELGKQSLNGLLAQFPSKLSEQAKANEDIPSWSLSIDENVTLEASNYPSWAVSFECRNESKSVENFKKKIWGH